MESGDCDIKTGDLVMIDYELPFDNEQQIGIVIKIEEGSEMVYLISSIGARWEFIHNLSPVQNKE